MTISGACLCGLVRYEVRGSLTFAGNCHCSICRRSHGAAYATWAGVPAGAFRWTEGEDLVERYRSSPGAERAFCRRCGSPLAVSHSGEVGEIVLASVLGDPGVRPTEHIFVDSRAPWHEITDSLPQSPEWPPHFAAQG